MGTTRNTVYLYNIMQYNIIMHSRTCAPKKLYEKISFGSRDRINNGLYRISVLNVNGAECRNGSYFGLDTFKYIY